MERASLMDVVVAESAVALELPPAEDEALSAWWDARLILNIDLDVVDGIGGVGPNHDGLACQGLDKDLEAMRALLFGRWWCR